MSVQQLLAPEKDQGVPGILLERGVCHSLFILLEGGGVVFKGELGGLVDVLPTYYLEVTSDRRGSGGDVPVLGVV